MGPLVKVLGARQLSVVLIGTLLFCHGVFGGLHLECGPPEWCAGHAEHTAEHQAAAGAGETHEHPADHGMSTAYFAMVALGLLGFLLRLLPMGAVGLRSWPGVPWPTHFRRVPAVLRPPPTPTPLTLQVFRL